MTDESRLALQLGLNLIAILLASWLAGRYAASKIREILDTERQRAQETRRHAIAEVLTNLPPIPPEFKQIVDVEFWVLSARDLQLLLTSLSTLIRIRLRAEGPTRQGVSVEIDQSLKHLERHENKWLNHSLAVVAYARQLDPARGKTRDQALETWLSRLNQAYVQAAQSLRRAACLCDQDDHAVAANTMANTYLTEADRAAAELSSMIAAALDRVAYLKQQLPEYQAQQISAAVATGPAYAACSLHESNQIEAGKEMVAGSATILTPPAHNPED
ncbi:MAG: hypothetical protein Kow0063_37420 [Anaerolineae bacterium]